MGAVVWSGLQACVGQDRVTNGSDASVPPDTGSTTYAPPALPLLEPTDEVCEALDAWILMQAGNGEPGEGSPDWEEFLHHLAELYPHAVAPESETDND